LATNLRPDHRPEISTTPLEAAQRWTSNDEVAAGRALVSRGSSFSLDPSHPNHLEPGKRPFHTIIPAMVMKGNKLFMSFGVMGGGIQPQGHVQVLVNLIDLGIGLQQAIDAPR
jgi:gamma-glutamyltranspeptidase / glutathione hydrolase